VLRALPLLGTARVRSPAALGRVELGLRRLEPRARRLAVAGQAAVAVAGLAVLAA
jgi:hypothetical protein